MKINASGRNDEKVRMEAEAIKSIGNSMTLPYDVSDFEQIKRIFYVLAESVVSRLREAGEGKCDTVHITVKDEFLREITRQKKILPTALCEDVARTACEIYGENFSREHKAHMLGLAVSGFDRNVEQLALDTSGEREKYEKNLRAQDAVAAIRKKYGYDKVQRGIILEDSGLLNVDIEHRKD